MAAQPLSKEVLEETLKEYYRQNKVVRTTGRVMSMPASTITARLDMIQRRFPEMWEKYQTSNEGIGTQWLYPQVLTDEIVDGCIIIGGDAHIWPEVNTIMMKAFVKLAKQLKPEIICLNGDIIDGARVSRHGSTLGSAAPKVSAEIDAAKKWMDQLPKCRRRIFTIGNHDMRVDNYLANQASELEDYAGRLADRFPMWEFCYAPPPQRRCGNSAQVPRGYSCSLQQRAGFWVDDCHESHACPTVNGSA